MLKKSFIFCIIFVLLFFFQIIGTGQVFEGNDLPADVKNITGLYHPQIDGIIDKNTLEWADSFLLTSDFNNKDSSKSLIKSWGKIVSDLLYLAIETDDDLKKIGVQFDMDNNGILTDGDVLLTVINDKSTIITSSQARFSISSPKFSEVTGLDIFSNGHWNSLADPRPSPIFQYNFGSVTKESVLATASYVKTKISQTKNQNVEISVSLRELVNFLNLGSSSVRFSVKSLTQKSPGLSSIGIGLLAETISGLKSGFPSKPQSTNEPSQESLPSFSSFLFDNTPPIDFSANIGIDGIEINQAVQNSAGTLSLIRDKLSLLRVYTSNAGPVPVNSEIQVMGRFFDGVNLFELGSISQRFIVPTTINRYDLSSTPNFILPASWTHYDHIQLDVFINPIGKTDTNTSDNSIAFVIFFQSTKDQTIFIIKMNNGNLTNPMSVSDPFINVQTAVTNAIFPVANIYSPIFGWGITGAWDGTQDELALALSERYNIMYSTTKFGRSIEPGYSLTLPDQLYAFLPNGSSFSLSSWVGGSSTIGIGSYDESKEFTLAHHLNHNYGPKTWGAHVSKGGFTPYGCGAPNPDTEWQNTRTNDEIGVLGWNQLYGLIDETTPDIMSYCLANSLPSNWISDYRWEHLTDLFKAQTTNIVSSWNNVPLSDLLSSKVRVVSGIIKSSLQAELSYSYTFPGYAEFPVDVNTTNSPYCLKINYQNGSNICIPIHPVFTDTKGDPHNFLFSFLIPEINSTASISLVNNTDDTTLAEISETNFTFNGSVNVPIVQSGLLTNVSWDVNISRAGGKLLPIKYYLQYTPDRLIWLPLGNPTTNMSQLVSFDNLPGGSFAKIRLIITDGVQSAILTSDTISIPTNDPEITMAINKNFKQYMDLIPGTSILTFLENNTVNHQKLSLGSVFSTLAHGYDLEDGIKSGNYLEWNLKSIADNNIISTTHGSIFSHVFNETGIFNLTVSVRDSHNKTALDTILLEVFTTNLFDNQTYTLFQESLKNLRDTYPTITKSTSGITSSSSGIITSEMKTIPILLSVISSFVILRKYRLK